MSSRFSKWLGDTLDARGVKGNELARRSGLSQSYVSELKTGKKHPEPETVQRIATSLGVLLDEALAAAGYTTLALRPNGMRRAPQATIDTRVVVIAPGVEAELYVPGGQRIVVTDEILERLRLEAELQQRRKEQGESPERTAGLDKYENAL